MRGLAGAENTPLQPAAAPSGAGEEGIHGPERGRHMGGYHLAASRAAFFIRTMGHLFLSMELTITISTSATA